MVGTRAVQRASTLSVSRQHCLTHKTPMEDKECNTLHHPLHLSSPSSPPSQCPFIRSVYILSAGAGHAVLGRLLDAVARVNSTALSLDELPQDIRPAALSTYKLTRYVRRSVSQSSSQERRAVCGFVAVCHCTPSVTARPVSPHAWCHRTLSVTARPVCHCTPSVTARPVGVANELQVC